MSRLSFLPQRRSFPRIEYWIDFDDPANTQFHEAQTLAGESVDILACQSIDRSRQFGFYHGPFPRFARVFTVDMDVMSFVWRLIITSFVSLP
jgi:hypothetical protein